MALNTPILFLIFNRPDTTERVFEAIREVRPTRLYVAADGPRLTKPGEAERCAEARRIATSVDWHCDVKTLFRDPNIGCRRAVSEAITWFFEHEEEGIILEDDCLPDQSFFEFCSILLSRYRNNETVFGISGRNHQINDGSQTNEYSWSIYPHIWGWATWRRAWRLYDDGMISFEPSIAKKIFRRHLPNWQVTMSWIAFLARVKSEQIHRNSWGYRWLSICFLKNAIIAIPKTNLVTNIGFGVDATHTKSAPPNNESIEFRGVMSFPLHHPQILTADKKYDAWVSHHIHQTSPSWLRRIVRRTSSIIGIVQRF